MEECIGSAKSLLAEIVVQDIERFAETLEMHDFAFAQELKRRDDGGVVAEFHDALIASPGFLLGGHIVGDVCDGIAGCADVIRRPGIAVLIFGEGAAVKCGNPSFHAGSAKLFLGCAGQHLLDHDGKHLNMA